ncbi:MAG: T9SS type A sorting domain-containing protein [Saprospiraceae bacterium]|nr:T9SS type A sorting domain-containing protein [Saprospiraceae bacterium]
MMKFSTTLILLFFASYAFATVWNVGPTRTYSFCSQVSTLVQNGDTIQIDFATYQNDPQVKWNKNDLYIVGIGGRPRLEAGSIIANDNVNGKGIFVVSGSNVRIENIEFANASVVDHNGAGIRQEGVNLNVKGCKFIGNEMGILQGGTIPNCTIIVEYCEFLNGGSTLNPGYQHNIYINHIDTLVFRYNFCYNAIAEGHEFKSRANYNYILYNVISNYQTVDSRNIDLPNGGTSIVMGNVIEQGANSANSNILGYGKEGLSNTAPHELWIVNNTFVNKKTSGSFIDVASGTNQLFLKNNIFAGPKTAGLILGSATTIDSTNNIIDNNIANIGFVDANNYDYHLLSNSIAVDAGASIATTVGGLLLSPDKMYKDTCDFEIRTISNNKIDVGAYEFINPTAITENSISNTFFIYPNPTSDFINISLSKTKQKFQIFGANGIFVKEVTLEHNGKIDVSHLPNGIYYIQSIDPISKAQRFIKTN